MSGELKNYLKFEKSGNLQPITRQQQLVWIVFCVAVGIVTKKNTIPKRVPYLRIILRLQILYLFSLSSLIQELITHKELRMNLRTHK